MVFQVLCVSVFVCKNTTILLVLFECETSNLTEYTHTVSREVMSRENSRGKLLEYGNFGDLERSGTIMLTWMLGN
jgi:hypothetical protein